MVSGSLVTDRASYRPGHPVHLTLTLQNVGTSVASITPNASTDGIIVSKGSMVVWRSTKTVPTVTMQQVVQPGQNMTLAATWNGRANQRGVRHLGPGVYTVSFTEGGYVGSTTIRVGRA